MGTGGLVGVGVGVLGTSRKDRAGPSNASFLRVAEASTPVPGWVRLERWLQEEGQRALWRCPGWLRPQTTKPHPPHLCPQTAPTGPCSQVPAWRDAERGWRGDRVGNGGMGGEMEGNRHRGPRRPGQMQTLRTEGSRERKRSRAGDTWTDSAGTVPLSLPMTRSPCSRGWNWGGGLQDGFALGSCNSRLKVLPHLMGRPRGRPQYHL